MPTSGRILTGAAVSSGVNGLTLLLAVCGQVLGHVPLGDSRGIPIAPLAVLVDRGDLLKHLETFADERLLSGCIYCGAQTESKDHTPSRALLDAPYPPHLPTVPACTKCNNGFSDDERYLACLIDCVLAGSTDPASVGRLKVRKTLERRPALRSDIESSRWEPDHGVGFNIDAARVESVLLKLARGHAAYELSEPRRDVPESFGFAPLTTLPVVNRQAFERLESSNVWPEIGSRAFQRAVEGWTGASSDEWIVVQPGRYRYAAYLADGIVVKMVLSDYLACEVRWI